MTTQIFLIRHGITAWNKQRRYCGRLDVGLSREGRQQAAKLRRKLEKVSFDKIYCSSKRRAVQTCRIIFGRARFTKVAGLREINFGVLEGLRHEEIAATYGRLYESWIKDPYKNRIPKAEPMRAFKKRICRTIRKIASSNPGKTVAVVCHGGAIGIFVSSVLKTRDFWRYVPQATSVTVVEYRKAAPRIKKFNDIAHLEQP
ncbi:MAG TPA: histidine phosphatase family protein [Patescibacteria group bacterium]|nr:histidine phosphatase family protein [Patescibacteria group bacterium]